MAGRKQASAWRYQLWGGFEHRAWHVARVTKEVQESNLPWLNDKCRQAVAAKHEAEGNANYNEAVTSTSEILRQERSAYMQRLRTKMENLLKTLNSGGL